MQQCKQGTGCTRDGSAEKSTQMLVDNKLNICQQDIITTLKAKYWSVLKSTNSRSKALIIPNTWHLVKLASGVVSGFGPPMQVRH